MPSPNVQRYVNNPTITLSGAPAWYAEQIYDFCPLVNPSNPSQLLLYCSGMASPVATGVQSIGLFTANILSPYVWTEHGGSGNGQVLQKGASGWDNTSSGIRAASAINIGGTVYLYYTGGYPTASIGVATATDNVTFTKSGSNPILSPSADETSIENMAVFHDPTLSTPYFAVYSYRTSSSTLPAYRAATSSNGTSWTKQQYITGAWRDVLAHAGAYHEWHSLFKQGSLYFLPYEYGTPNSTAATWTVRFAVSAIPTGPYTDLTYDPVLSGSGDSNWDKDHVATPAVFFPGGDPLLFYCGSNDNIPTPGNTNYNNNQWPAGMAYFANGIPLDIGNIVAPGLCQKRCQLTFNGGLVLESNTYAVCFGGSGNTENGLAARLPDELFTLAQSDGGDICFTSDAAGANQLACEVVNYTPGSKKCEIWVGPTSLTASSSTSVYVWYQSRVGTLRQPPANYAFGSMSVWYPNFQLVHHLQNAVPPAFSDPGFESPNVGTGTNAFQYNPSGAPWTYSTQSGVAGNGSAFTSGNPNAPQGTQVGFVQFTGTISQTVNFAAGSYALTIQAAQRAGNASTQTFAVQVDGVTISSFTPSGTSYASYTTVGFTVSAGNHTISFVGLNPNGGDNTALLDVATLLLADSTANQYVFTPKGTPANVQGELGQGVSFGTGNYYTGPAINCNFTNGWVTWWAKPTNAYNQAGEIDIIFAQENPSTPYTPAFEAQKYSDGNFYIGFQASGTDYRWIGTASGAWTAGAWQRYDYIWTASSSLLYYNGALVTPTGPGSRDPTPVPVAMGYNFNIAQQILNVNNPFVGSLDEFRMANVAPTANYLSTDYSIQSATNFVTVGTPQYVGIPSYTVIGQGLVLPGAPWAAGRRGSLAGIGGVPPFVPVSAPTPRAAYVRRSPIIGTGIY